MTRAHYQYVLLEQGVGAFVVNVAINAGIAWLLFRSLSVVPLWGAQSIAGDTVATCFILPLLTCLIVTRLAHREIRRGRFGVPDWRRESIRALARLPAATSRRALLFGVACALVIGPVTVGVLALAGVAELPFSDFVTFKALFAGGLAALVSPVIALAAITDTATVGGVRP